MSSVPAGVLFVLDRPRSRSGLRDGRSTNRVRPKGRTLGTGKTTWVQFGSIGFTDVPRTLYTQAMLGVYELNDVSLLKDVFIWAYGRSAEQYVAVRQSLGEPDPFRFKQRAALRQVVGDVVRERLDRKAAAAFLTKWIEENIVPEEHDRFREMAETDLLNIHEWQLCPLPDQAGSIHSLARSLVAWIGALIIRTSEFPPDTRIECHHCG